MDELEYIGDLDWTGLYWVRVRSQALISFKYLMYIKYLASEYHSKQRTLAK